MQTRSIDISLTQSLHTSAKPAASEHAELEHMPVQALIKTLTLGIEEVPLERRGPLTRLSVPGLFSALKVVLSKTSQCSSHASGKKGSVHFENSLSNLSEDLCQIEFKQANLPIKQTILDRLLFMANPQQFLGNVCLDQILLSNPQELIQLLTDEIQPTDRRLMKEAADSPPSLEQLNVALGKCESKGQIQRLVVPFLKSSLLLQLKRCLHDKEETDSKIRAQSVCWRQWDIFWKGLAHQDKLQVMLLDCKDVQGLVAHLQQRRISLSRQQIERMINDALDLKAPTTISSFFSVPFHSLNHPINQYWELLYYKIHSQILKNTSPYIGKQIREDRDYNSQQKLTKDISQPRKKKGKRKSMSSESNQTNYTEHEQQIIQRTIRYRQQQPLCQLKEVLDIKYEQRLERSQEEKREVREHAYSTEREARTIKAGKNKLRSSKLAKDKEEKIREINDSVSKCELGNPEIVAYTSKQDCLSSQKTFVSTSSGNSASQARSQQGICFSREALKIATLNKLAEELSEMSDGISEQANLYYQRRIIAFSRIQFLLSHCSIPIKLFGSCANGIAVKNSDIDIAIDQSILYWMDYLPENEKVIVALERLQQLFKAYACFKQLKLIKTAAIPVIKLTVDTSVPFISQEYHQLNRPHNAGLIQADITIETVNQDNQSSHLGISTTCTISRWLSEIKSLHSIVIIMKQFFAVSKLNLAYEGGLNTISMIVMLVAYIIDAGLQAEENEALVLEKVLRFYTDQFDQKETGIDLMKVHANSIYYEKVSYPLDNPQLMKAELQIRDPICQGKNMTRNCYKFPEIKRMFKSIIEKCFDRRMSQLEEALSREAIIEQKQLWMERLGVVSQASFSGNVFLELHSHMCKPL